MPSRSNALYNSSTSCDDISLLLLPFCSGCVAWPLDVFVAVDKDQILIMGAAFPFAAGEFAGAGAAVESATRQSLQGHISSEGTNPRFTGFLCM